MKLQGRHPKLRGRLDEACSARQNGFDCPELFGLVVLRTNCTKEEETQNDSQRTQSSLPVAQLHRSPTLQSANLDFQDVQQVSSTILQEKEYELLKNSTLFKYKEKKNGRNFLTKLKVEDNHFFPVFQDGTTEAGFRGRLRTQSNRH